ncbi:MAG: hypothetical protein WC516_03015 [Patescibacteria group bacterium]
MKRCPRFEHCSSPKCPLDYWQDDRIVLTGDEKCGVAKSIRMRIGKDTELPLKGLTKREFLGRQQWEQKSESERRKFVEFGQGILKGRHKTSKDTNSKG